MSDDKTWNIGIGNKYHHVNLHSLSLKTGVVRFQMQRFISASFENLEFVKESIATKGTLLLGNNLTKILKLFFSKIHVHVFRCF